ncbi:LOW QUALITY PROTEIN: trichohyalin-like [Microcaecilia unicolor]|uniref:LOW QUALITY PROTEIN: trichohyalin-like n=1 Tax=Microcaecilia unicolor TaxID=1415580 RepID=A0A6P7WNT0_9AMPH|nr:LOW QUALITY PROTEIN: trichohyalin-like [Microcaecilia unicolor]
MTETEIDDSSLHGVQEVCRDFAVLEDGALAHCLQKQEIEQHYALNIQKNKLVQKDIRIAKKLQDEEDQQSKLQCLQKRRQIEERDLAYARVIQEELQKKAEEWQQREVEDQEVARKLQELEEEAEHQDRRWSLGSRSRHREHGRPLTHQPCLRETHSEEEEEEEEDYYLYHRENDCSPNTAAGRRNLWKLKQGFGWKDSHEQFTNSGFFCGNDSSQDALRDSKRRPHFQKRFCSEPYRDRPQRFKEASCKGHREFSEDCGPTQAERAWEEFGRSHRREINMSKRGQKESRERFSKQQSERYRRSSSESEVCPEQEVRDKRSRYSQRSQSREQRTHHNPSTCPSRRRSPVSQADGNRRHCRDKDPLEGQLSGLQIKNSDQLLRDEELARRLQEEEKNELATLKHQRQNEDFRAAQVAQDEEIAKYIQHQELKAHQRSQEVEFRRTSTGVSGSERRGHTDRKAELAASHSERLNSEGLVTPTEGLIPEGSDFATEGASAERTKQPLPRNIAEALDPTFQSSQKEPSASVLGVRSQDCPVSSQPCAVPVEGFYDFLDDGNEPVFVSPTKRQPEKLGQQKSRDKKEGCKQQ